MCQKFVPSGYKQCLKPSPSINFFTLPFSWFTIVQRCFMFVRYVQGMDVEGCESSQRRMATGTLSCELASSATGPLNRTLMPAVATSWRNSKRPRSLWHSGGAVNPTFYHLLQTPEVSPSNSAAQIGKTPIRFTTHANLGTLSGLRLNPQRWFSNLARGATMTKMRAD